MVFLLVSRLYVSYNVFNCEVVRFIIESSFEKPTFLTL